MKLMICLILFHVVILGVGSEFFAKTVFKNLVKMATHAKQAAESCADNVCKESEEDFIHSYIENSVQSLCGDDNNVYLHQQFLSQVKEHTMKKFEEYDVEINPEGHRLKAIGNVGWSYTNGNSERFDELKKNKAFKAFYVCVLGKFNHGKTWLINLLSNRLFEYGFDRATKSIGCVLPAGVSHIVYCDSPGTSRAVNIEDLNDRLGTDMITEEAMIHISDMLLLVCGPLTTDEQLKHRRYIDRVSEIAHGAKSTKIIYIVHNWMHLPTMKQVDNFIKRDIIDPYGAELRFLKGHKFYLHLDNQTGFIINHFIFAADGSEAGEFWNKNTLQMLKSLIENTGQTMARRSFHIIKEFKKELEPLLRETFTTEVKDESSFRKLHDKDIYWNMVKAPRRLVTKSGKMFWSNIGKENEYWVKSYLLDDMSNVNTQSSDPYELVSLQNTTLRLKRARNLEYFNTPKIGGKPVSFYRPRFGIFVSNSIWEVQIQIPECDWWNSTTKSGIKVLREGDKLIVEGIILKPDRGKEKNGKKYVFDVLIETRRFGYFHMPFELPPCVNRERCMNGDEIGWLSSSTPSCPWKKSLQNGILTVTADAEGCKLPESQESDDFEYDYE